MDASAWAAVVVAGGTVLLAIIGVAGYLFGKQTRAEDQAERFGRLEGWADAAGNRRSGGDSVTYSLGSLREAVENIKDDIKEIRRSQREDTDYRIATRDLITRMQSDISSLRRSFQDVTRKFSQMGR